ncbi:MAG: Wzz/FepE/Etk N-terminal domain-containing protein, partial [Chloroflexota bacterium]
MPLVTGEAATKDLRDYLGIAWRRRRIILIITLLVTGAAAAYSYSRPAVYAANARLLLQRSQSSILLGEGISYLDPSLLATEIQIIQTPPVRALVLERLGFAPSVTATAVGNTAIINIRATGRDSQQAADVANAYAEAYISYRLAKTVDGLALATKELESRISGLSQEIESLDAQAASTPRPPNT